MKVKIILDKNKETFDALINDFIAGKDIVDIKYASGNKFTFNSVLIMYE